MSDNLIKKITEVVNKSGVPLEMFCAKTFIDHGWQVDHLTHYRDDQENNPLREIDLVCSPPNHENIKVVVSCKNSSDNHWILHSIKNPSIKKFPYQPKEKGKSNLSAYAEMPFIIEPGYLHAYFQATSDRQIFQYLNEDIETLLEEEKEYFDDYDIDIQLFRDYWLPERVSIFQSVLNRAERSDDLPIRNAALSAISAIKSLSNFSEKPEDSFLFEDPDHGNITFWFPLIVFGGKLFEVYYGDDYEFVSMDEHGQLTPKTEITEIQKAKCTFSTDIPLSPHEYNHSTIGIDVITVKHLSDTINSISNVANFFNSNSITDDIVGDWATYLQMKGYFPLK